MKKWLRAMKFKNRTTDGSITHYYCAECDHDGILAIYIKRSLLSNKEDQVWIDQGYKLVKKYKDRYLYSQIIYIKLESLMTIFDWMFTSKQ